MGERISAHQIRLLNPKESWKLFLKKLSQGDERANWYSEAMLDVGKEMVTKCDGLPLGIVVLGGLLAQKKGLHEWQTVRERIWSHLISGSVEISQLLSLSYEDFSSELKLCFLYVGVYPEDYDFNATQLMWSWIAEDFIKQGVEGKEMEDIAQAYLNELINHNMIQVATIFWGEIYRCRIHDLVRNLAVKKAIEVEFFDIYKPVSTHPPLLRHVRRQVVHTGIQRYENWIVIQTHNLINLQELKMDDIKRQNGKDYLLESISNLKSLYTLALQCTDEESGFPPMDFMSSLHKLRKLSLYGKLKMFTSIEKWPQSITMLMLVGSELEENPIPTVARLPNLTHLDSVKRHKSGIISFPPQSFPQLGQLGLCHFSELKMLELDEEALPIINSLYVIQCVELKDDNMPERLKSILIRETGDNGVCNRIYVLYDKD